MSALFHSKMCLVRDVQKFVSWDCRYAFVGDVT